MNILEGINQAIEHTKNNELKKAEKIYLELLKENPENEKILSFLGLLYVQMDKISNAEKYLIKAYKLSKNDVLIPYLANIKMHLRKYDSATILYEYLIKNNKKIEYYEKIIACASNSEKWALVYKYANEAHSVYPINIMFIEMLAYGSVYMGKYKEAELYATKCLRYNSKSTVAFDILGLLQEILYCNEEAARKYYRLMVKYGDCLGGYQNLYTSYGKDAKHRRSQLYYLKKIVRYSDEIDPFCIASYFLSHRQFKRGFRFYVMKNVKDYNGYLFIKQFKKFWEGEKSKGETLFVFGDQGLGDQLMFARYLPFLEKRFDKIKVKVNKALYPLFKRSFKACKNMKFYPHIKETKSLPKHDKAVYLSHLPYYLNINFNHIPAQGGYLIPNTEKVEAYRAKYFNNDKLKIGICWEAGATGIREQIHRILNVELFEDIINLPNAEVYSFQHEPSLDNYKKYHKLINLAETFKDFDDTVAALQNIDILVTVDTSLLHAAGATGVNTIMVLPYATDWRWFDDNEKTDWYSSVRIVKQHTGEPWQECFKRIKKVLDEKISEFGRNNL